jgi:Endosomal/lysosomal potassium channel TMEM175
VTKTRLEAFSDGVLAIAITLLVIEIHPPELHQGQRLAQALWAQWPSYLAYLVSFLTIGVIWLNHHRLFEQVAWVTRDARLLHRPPPPGVVRGARLRFTVGLGVYAVALALSWVSAPLALALCGLTALYYAFDQASMPAAVEPSDRQPTGRST